ncbi:MAG: translation elongation factor Ts [Hyphomicrobiaceae bacterium]|nr:translation elongation factor Ts [Hyphomicrobiaceae bacterium]
MTTITAAMVKELRDKTGAGMMDCKAALSEVQGDIEQAVDWLRKKGLSKAAKKADRIAADGLIGVAVAGKSGAVVEVNSETDFVARNDKFQDMVRQIAGLSQQAGGSLERLLSLGYPGTANTVETHVKEMVATIGENMSVRRTAALEAKEGVVASYVHNRVVDGLGKIGVLVAVESAGAADSLAEIGRQVALHIAAANPQAISPEDLDKNLIERERQVYLEQAKASGKSDDIVAKMVEGRLRKEFFSQVVLMQQVFFGPGGDGKMTVEQYLKDAQKAAGAPVKIARFVRFALGEGIDKKGDDFASEVAKLAKSS